MKKQLTVLFVSLCFVAFAQEATKPAFEISKKWQPLLDKSLSNFEVYVGVPHSTVVLDGYPKSDDVRKGTPLGLNDPKKVMSTIEKDGELLLAVSGEIYAGLTTMQEFENYHLKAQFKWGEKIWEPRLKAKRDNGILYHCHGEHGTFWNVWMSSLEFQIQETDMGDFVALVDTRAEINSTKVEDKLFQVKGETDQMITYGGGKGNPGYCHIKESNENPHGEWNTVELICVGNKSIHVVNGKVVMIVNNARTLKDGREVTLTKGKLQFQSEAAEAYYKNIEIKSVTKFPKAYAKQMNF